MRFGQFFVLLIFSMIFSTAIYSQIPGETKNASTFETEMLKVFIDCENCDYFYIRRNITFVNHVRDRRFAQVHVLITDQKTASRGWEYTLKFIGNQNFKGIDHTLTFISHQFDSDDQIRQGLAKMIKMGLLIYVASTPEISKIKIIYDEKNNDKMPHHFKDIWNYWVFQIGIGGELEAEETRNKYNLVGTLCADRITEAWKINSRADYEYEEENFEEDEGTLKSALRELEWNSSVVKSLTEKWSVGLFNNIDHTTFRNIQFGYELAPAVEFNIYPWSESEGRIVAFAYYPGIKYFNYIEETIFDKTSEILGFQALVFRVIYNQPWGRVKSEVEGSHYFHDFSKNRVEFDTELSLHLIKGLSLALEFEAKMIHDQLYLPKGDATIDEILLKRKKLATTFEISSIFSLRYTFGSIYHSIVNRRFED
jgi:hypothetical protein